MLNVAFLATCGKSDDFAFTFLHQMILNIFQTAKYFLSLCNVIARLAEVLFLPFAFSSNHDCELDLRKLQSVTMSRAYIFSVFFLFAHDFLSLLSAVIERWFMILCNTA